MIHIFTVHSNLTFLVAYGIIEHENINAEDVVIIADRYNVPVNFFSVVPAYYEVNGSLLSNRLLNFNYPKAYDRYINEVTNGNKFIAYIDLLTYTQKVLITHRNCIKFNFFEEGNSSYQSIDDFKDVTWNERDDEFRLNYSKLSFFKAFYKVLRGYNLRLLGLPYIYTAYTNFSDIKFYCFSYNAFFNAPPEKKILLRPQNNSSVTNTMAAGIKLNNKLIWLDGSNSKYTGLDESYYHKAIDKAIEIIKEKKLSNNNEIYLKLRPGIQHYSSNYLYKTCVDAGFDVTVLPDLVLESLFINSKSCVVVGVLTAALEYAHIFGHNSYTIYNLFDRRPKTIFDRMSGFMDNLKPLH